MGNTEFINKLQFPLIKNKSSKEDNKNNKENKENTIKPKKKINETGATLKASSISLFNCKEGVLENWDDDFDIGDEKSHTYDSSVSFTITPGIYCYIYIYIYIFKL